MQRCERSGVSAFEAKPHQPVGYVAHQLLLYMRVAVRPGSWR
jgi:hypothetical protein